MLKWSEICDFKLTFSHLISIPLAVQLLFFLVWSHKNSLIAQRIVIVEPMASLEREWLCVCVYRFCQLFISEKIFELFRQYGISGVFHLISRKNQLVNVFFDHCLPSSTSVQVLLIGAINQFCGYRGHECLVFGCKSISVINVYHD